MVCDNASMINDIVSSIKHNYGISANSILETNDLILDSAINPFYPILILNKSVSCKVKPDNFFCYCLNNYLPALVEMAWELMVDYCLFHFAVSSCNAT
ncbi:unnamed protein product [Thlaspi arvense]|uniref:LysM domain-containing protein n=1 Tax=Thlaspi arvense TaxID=13288 RepID=A0AAU9RL47_THLAR|nr:unnamed protein product [Thlaspi arvense]